MNQQDCRLQLQLSCTPTQPLKHLEV